eukprot:jgi/Picre1/35475/NNA_002937.t1
MDIGCNCFGVATAAKVPVKRYNLLVPAVFPVTEPSPTKKLLVGVEKNIKRLSDYLERNEHRIPKVSRRLGRTLHSDLRKRKLGYVRVAVETYRVLLQACDNRFARLYAQELLIAFPKKSVRFGVLNTQSPAHGTSHLESVVGVLLSDKSTLVQSWGIELLLHMIKIQDSAEFIIKLDNFVPLVCRLAVPTSAGRDDAMAESVSAVALQCLLEHLRLCSRISYAARHMDMITTSALKIIDAEGDAAITAYQASKVLKDDVNSLAMSRLSIGARIGASTPCQAAILIFKEIGAVTLDSVESRNVTEYWIDFMEKKPSRWSGGAALEVGLGVLRDSCTLDHQVYALSCSLLRHLASLKADAGEVQKKALLHVTLSQAQLLRSTDSAALLLLMIRIMGPIFSEKDIGRDTVQYTMHQAGWRSAVYDAVCTLAKQTHSRCQVASVIEAALSHMDNESVGTLWLCEAAGSTYLDIPVDSADDCNVTETMVTSMQSICSPLDSSSDTMKVSIMKCLGILRHTFEAAPPSSLTSTRCVRALMSFLWTLWAALVRLQGYSWPYKASLVGYKNSQEHEFCGSKDVPSSQVNAAAAISHAMWECLKNVVTDHVTSQLDAFKPSINSTGLLHINAIGMAVANEDIDEFANFPRQAEPLQFSCPADDNPDAIMQKIFGHASIQDGQMGFTEGILMPSSSKTLSVSLQLVRDSSMEVAYERPHSSDEEMDDNQPISSSVMPPQQSTAEIFSSGEEFLRRLSHVL